MESGDIRRIPAALAFFAAFYALSPSGKSAHTVPSGSLSLSSGIWIGFHLLITEFSVEPTGCKHRRRFPNICLVEVRDTFEGRLAEVREVCEGRRL